MHRAPFAGVEPKDHDFCFRPIVLTLVAQAAPCRRSLHVSRVWKGSEQREAGATVSTHVTWLFSSLHAAIMAGQGVKGNTVAKHAGIHGLWVTLPLVLAALEGFFFFAGFVARVRWQLPQRCMVTNLRGISSGQTPVGCYSAPAL